MSVTADRNEVRNDFEKVTTVSKMVMAAVDNDSNYDCWETSMTISQKVMVTVTGWEHSNCYCELFVLIVLLIMITKVGKMNVKLNYFSLILMMMLIIVKHDCKCNYELILIFYDDVNCRSNWIDKNVTMSRILTDDDYSFFAITKFLKIIEH